MRKAPRVPKEAPPAKKARVGIKRIVVYLVAAVFVAGSAGAYVPSSPSLPQMPGTTDAPPREPDSARDFDRLLGRLERQERDLEQELKELGPKRDTVQKRMLARGRQYYRLVRAGMLPIGEGFDGLVDHASRVERLRAALARDIATERALGERQATARKDLRHVRTERAPLVVQREAMRQAEQAMKQADERRDAFQRAFGASEDPPHISVYGADTGPAAEDPNVRFAAMKGRLPFPLAGRAEISNDAKDEIGLRLRASRDTAVRAVYPGTVAFAGETDRGLTVVLDHGDHYFTTYANLQRLEVKVGDALPERGRIAWVLRHGSKPPVLYFELSRGRNLVDPRPWLGL
jgi:murein DD-endopeptidase MepM/ murein hydrolase activator NlpD